MSILFPLIWFDQSQTSLLPCEVLPSTCPKSYPPFASDCDLTTVSYRRDVLNQARLKSDQVGFASLALTAATALPNNQSSALEHFRRGGRGRDGADGAAEGPRSPGDRLGTP